MTPQEAQDFYEQQWPVLNAQKQVARGRGDTIGAKKARQALSALSSKCSARHELHNEPVEHTKTLRSHISYVQEIERLKSAIRAMQEIATETLKK